MVNLFKDMILSEFSLHSRLSADTKPIFSFEKSELFLVNDARWPWLIVVPTIPDSVEWHELEEKSGQLIDQDVSLAAKVLKQITNCEKINIASLGNMVRQLHIHIVARDTGDPNWPNPVWGFGEKIAYKDEDAQDLIEKISLKLEETTA